MNQPAADLEHLETRVAKHMAALLNEGSRDPGHAISERLRVARERALEVARESRLQTATTVHASGGAAALGGWLGGPRAWFPRLAFALPAVALAAGLVIIDQMHDRAQIEATADVDLALLSDDVPPGAYSDDGFAAYLRANGAAAVR